MLIPIWIMWSLAGGSPASTEVDFKDVCQAFAGAQSYRFEIVTRSDGAGFGAQAGRRGPGAASSGGGGTKGTSQLTKASDPTSGEFEKGQPIHLTRGKTQVFRGEKTSAFQAAGMDSWGTFGVDETMAQVMKKAEGPRREVMAAMTMSKTVAPHELFESFDTLFSVGQRREDSKGIQFQGTLTAEGAQRLAGGWSRMGRAQQATGARAPKLNHTGEFVFHTDAKGAMTQIVIKTVTSGTRRGEAFERIQETSIRVNKVGETSVDVPSEVASKLQ